MVILSEHDQPCERALARQIEVTLSEYRLQNMPQED